MDDTIDLEVDTRALELALLNLPKRFQGRVMRDALEAAGEVILESMVAHAPERTDEETPDGTSLPPGILKADLTTQVIMGTSSAPLVKIGPTDIAGYVARWQNNGWTLTTHGRKRSRRQIKEIPGKHFMEAAFDESASRAVDVLLERLAAGADYALSSEGAGPETDYGGENY